MTTDRTVPVSIVEPGIERNREPYLELSLEPDAEPGAESDPERAFEAAVEHIRFLKTNPHSTEVIFPDSRPIRSSLAKSQTGYVAIFRLVSLELVARRFGVGGLCELRQVIRRCLLKNLQPEDRIYDLAQDTFLAVCDRRTHPARQEQLSAELCRVLARNRDFPIHVGERKIMLRIPISVAIHPVSQLGGACQLRELLQESKSLNVSSTTAGSEMPDGAVVAGEVPLQESAGAGE